ncbi:MAG: septal ring lytic transglycosylase RlpA family protein [Luteimonas sp.]
MKALLPRAPIWMFALASSACLMACTGAPSKSTPPHAVGKATPTAPARRGDKKVSPYAPAQEDLGKRGHYTAGGLYAPHIQDSAPTEAIDVDAIPEPEVTNEPRSSYGNRSPYKVLGKSYEVRDRAKGYDESGLASYYGNKFHGRRTSNLEVYDMYAFTAAHKTLPLPSFARVTNLDNGKSVIVRVNDRGPFHEGRIIDLSYAAAVKLDIQSRGTGRVEVRGLSPGESARQDYDAVAAHGTPGRDLPTATPVALPAGSGALKLPPGVRIATGKPQPAPPSAMDTLLEGVLPSARASERSLPLSVRPATAGRANVMHAAAQPAAATAGASDMATATAASVVAKPASDLDWRFDMRQDGKAMTADQFDAWMKSRRARVATGKAGKPDPSGSATPVVVASRGRNAGTTPAAETLVAARVADAASPRASAGPAAPRVASLPASASISPIASGAGMTLQVAAFGARANAERALAMVRGAGVDDARLLDGLSAGKQVWRLRVGPVASARVAELSARVAGLGFGQPQLVRE